MVSVGNGWLTLGLENGEHRSGEFDWLHEEEKEEKMKDNCWEAEESSVTSDFDREYVRKENFEEEVSLKMHLDTYNKGVISGRQSPFYVY